MNRSGLALLIVGVVVGGVGGYVLRRPVSPAALVSATAAAKPKAEHEVLYWYDPMRPDQHFDKPGKSPYMDMQLLPKYADGNRGGGAVEVDPRAAQNLGIRTVKVERGTLEHDLRAVGTVGYDEDAVAVVQARAAGFVRHVYVRAALDRVRRGQPLVEVVAPDWGAAQQEYLALRNADSTLRDAARARLLVLGVPEDQIRAIERSGTARATTTLVAPIDGVIAELGARDGMAMMPGTPLFRINGLTKVWITAEVPEAQAASARGGTAVAISVLAWPGRTFPGKVLAVLPSVAAATRTLQVRIEAVSPDGALTPGMYANLAFESAVRDTQLLVPSEAVIHTGTRALVIVADADGFRPIEVATGAEGDGKTEILHGLEEGERIVSSGQFLIDSEASLRSSLTRLGAPASEAKP